MICPCCNAQVPKGVVFCPVCGEKVIKHLSSEAAALASLEVVSPEPVASPPEQAAPSTAVLTEQQEAFASKQSVPPDPNMAASATTSNVAAAPNGTADPNVTAISNTTADPTAVATPNITADPTVTATSDITTAAPVTSETSTAAPSATSPAANVSVPRPKSRKEKKALRARLRTIGIAYKQGTLQRLNPRLHVHDNNESAKAAPVQSVTDLLDRYMLRQQVIWGALTALVVLCLAGIIFLLLPRGFFGGVPVPDVRGSSAADATAILRNKGFEVAVQNAFVDDSAGLVMATDPNPDKLQGLGKTVTLTVGELRYIPPIQGANYSQALKKLREFGYQNVHVTGVDSPSENDVVVGIEPAANSTVPKDQPVTLTLKHMAS